MPKRTALSKSKRFAIFARDQHTCRYCGKQPPEIKLVVDHVIPVVEGGTNDETNLITACHDCNAGKGKKLLNRVAPTDQDELRVAQEFMEQISLAELAAEASEARGELRQQVVNHWCQCFGVNGVGSTNVSRLVNKIESVGVNQLFRAIEITAGSKVAASCESDQIRYCCGVCNRMDEQKSVTTFADMSRGDLEEWLSSICLYAFRCATSEDLLEAKNLCRSVDDGLPRNDSPEWMSNPNHRAFLATSVVQILSKQVACGRAPQGAGA